MIRPPGAEWISTTWHDPNTGKEFDAPPYKGFRAHLPIRPVPYPRAKPRAGGTGYFNPAQPTINEIILILRPLEAAVERGEFDPTGGLYADITIYIIRSGKSAQYPYPMRRLDGDRDNHEKTILDGCKRIFDDKYVVDGRTRKLWGGWRVAGDPDPEYGVDLEIWRMDARE